LTKLNQIVAVEKGVKSTTHSNLTALHHMAQRTQANGPLFGIARTYQPRDDDGEKLPSESTRVQVRADELLDRAATALTRLFDVTATKDWANCDARADVKIDGHVLLADVPVTYLLFLEKQLVDLRTFVSKLPTLDPAENWSYSAQAECWATDPVETTRTKKVPHNHVLAEATPQHPAQVQVYTEDVVVGTWRTVKFSGALPAERVTELVRRVEALQMAVKFAREDANGADVIDQRVGAAVFSYLFAA
jgi:hypothetical protein